MKRVSKVLTALVLGTVLAGLAAGCGTPCTTWISPT